MPVTQLGPADYVEQPWRNGQGTSLQLAVDDQRLWFFNLADIPAAAPFSDFRGYDRVLAVIDGAGLRLQVAKRPPVLLTLPSMPYRFSGDAETKAAPVGGPVRVANLIYRRDAILGSMSVFRAHERALRLQGTLLVHVVRGETSVAHAAFGRRDLAAGQTLALEELTGDVALQSRAGCHTIVASLTPLGDAPPRPPDAPA